MKGLAVIAPGVQSTLQATPRSGHRHVGVPSGGAADGLSHALANRLVANDPEAATLEVTFGAVRFRFGVPTVFAVTGAHGDIVLQGQPVCGHTATPAQSGDVLEILPPREGCRAYLAVAGGFVADTWLGSRATYLPAGRGGHGGCALATGDELAFGTASTVRAEPQLTTPPDLRPHIGQSWVLRACLGPEGEALSRSAKARLFDAPFKMSPRLDRMGGALGGAPVAAPGDGRMPSAAVFPGTVQCPPSGVPFLLMADAGTTGGYPRIAQIIRADRHLMGQIRPGDTVRFLRVSPDKAAEVLRDKTALFSDWLGDAFELY